MQTTTRKHLSRLMREWRAVFILVGTMLLFRSAVADWMVVPSGSMNPTVVEGDRVLVDKRAYGWRLPFTLTQLVAVGDPQRGDIVVLESPDVAKTTLLKRVLAVPGDTIALRGDRLILNGVAVSYDEMPSATGNELLKPVQELFPSFYREDLPGKPHDVMLLPQIDSRRDFGPIQVPAGHYVMIGDNRDNSRDSRYFGLVERRAIFGKATRVLLSLNPEEHFLPRKERFLGPLL